MLIKEDNKIESFDHHSFVFFFLLLEIQYIYTIKQERSEFFNILKKKKTFNFLKEGINSFIFVLLKKKRKKISYKLNHKKSPKIIKG